MTKIEILQKNVDAAYDVADGNVRKLLDALFGERDIREIVGSYEDACRYNGKKPHDRSKLLDAGVTLKQIAGIELEEITLALNKGLPSNIYNGEARWCPVFACNGSPSGFAFYYSYCADSYAYAGGGARLSYHEETISNYSGTKFEKLWQEYLS